MSKRHPIGAALIAVALLAATASGASAAQVTIQPSPAEARTFATTNGGWSSAVDFNGLVCIPGVTCPSATPSYQATGGTGGAGDGFLRNGFGTLLGVLSTTTISWASRSFVAPTTDTATLSVAVRPQIASLLAICSVNLNMGIVDVADPTRTRTVATVPLTAASASFSTVQATVPPGTIVAGRTYRVQLDTVLTTSVSAVASGNVDLDDVVLRLVDLEPPSGLTAAFQSTGAPRIAGTVDPAGQTTSVVADYGPTAAYGSSTTPVVVSGTGSQPFAIPLAGLTPGQTYHYRVTATSADGAVSTSDATFVAPTPPTDAPPLVDGPGNSRNRTVVYDRPGDVADATVEILDGGGNVVDTIADADRDGSVAIALPDADGTYGVRVVRTNAGGQSSTSATVPAVLDRVAPDTAAVAANVRPQLSRDTQRSVEYAVPGDVVAVLAQVIDASGADVGAPVAGAGGAATVQLGTADGDYRVRLTLTDAAGNSATVLTGVATLDATAPGAGGAPTVTGPGNGRDRDVEFERDATTTTATIEALDRAGAVVATTTVLVGDSGTVTLPDADGDYTIRVSQADLAGNSATTAGTPVALDRVAPDPGPAPRVLGTDVERDRTVQFTRAGDAATATIELLDDEGRVIARVDVPSGGRGAVRLPDVDGDYAVQVGQADAAGNSATTPAMQIALDRGVLDAGPAPTISGAPDALLVAFRRSPDAVSATIEVVDLAGNVLLTVPVAGDSAKIDLPDGAGRYLIRVRQTDAAGNSATTPQTGVTRASGSGDRTGPDDGDDDTTGGNGRTGGGTTGTGTAPGGGTTTGTPNAPGPAAAPALSDPGGFGTILGQCFAGGEIVLTDVNVRGSRVTVGGITRFAPGTAVTIVDLAGRAVGTTTVDATGRFATPVTAASTARARLAGGFRAAVGGVSSRAVKVRRANVLTRAVARGTTITLRGRVDVARLGRLRSVRAYGGAGAAPCRTTAARRTVGKLRVDRRTGAYQLRVRAPSGTGKLVLRTRAWGTKLASRSSFLVK